MRYYRNSQELKPQRHITHQELFLYLNTEIENKNEKFVRREDTESAVEMTWHTVQLKDQGPCPLVASTMMKSPWAKYRPPANSRGPLSGWTFPLTSQRKGTSNKNFPLGLMSFLMCNTICLSVTLTKNSIQFYNNINTNLSLSLFYCYAYSSKGNCLETSSAHVSTEVSQHTRC